MSPVTITRRIVAAAITISIIGTAALTIARSHMAHLMNPAVSRATSTTYAQVAAPTTRAVSALVGSSDGDWSPKFKTWRELDEIPVALDVDGPPNS